MKKITLSKMVFLKNAIFIFLALWVLPTLKTYAQCTDPDNPPGDQATYGEDQWIGYVYTYSVAANPPANPFETYRGFINRSENFDLDLGEGAISANDICGSYDAAFAIRFKMHKNLTPGFYTFLVGGDDGYRLSVDGGATFLTNANAWYDHSYITSQTTLYLSGDTNFVYEFYEDATTARISFNYTYTACNTSAPTAMGNTVIYSCVGSTILSADGGTAGANSSYEWGTGTTVGANIIPGATQQTYTTTVAGPYWVRRVLGGDCSGYTDGVTATVTASNNTPGDPSVFGDNAWTVYAYTDVNGNFNNPSYVYKGYYTQNTLGFSSFTGDNSWPKNGSPDQSANYMGCSIGSVDNFAFHYKRKGFPCGEYSLFMDNWDDDTFVYINGVQVWSWIGWSGGANDTQKVVGTYTLDATTEIEVYTREGGGDANSQLNITEISPSTAPVSINGSAVACAGSTITLTSNGGVLGADSEYQWGSGTVGSNIISGQTAGTATVTITGDTTYWVRIKKTGCDNYTAAATLTVTTPAPVVYNGQWSSTPDSTSAIEIQTDLTLPDDIEVCSCHVTQNAVLTITEGKNFTVDGIVVVDNGSNLILQNKASLLQNTTAQNIGKISVVRSGSKVMRLDYSIWSSPVTGQSLLNFSPLTLPSRFYSFNTITNLYNYVPDPANTYFETGKGYLIRVPNNHPTTPTVYTGTFTGIPHNGDISVPLVYNGANSYNMMGNPYPSPIDINNFITTNINDIDGTLWFWRKTNDINATSYSTVTTMAYNPNQAAGGENDYATDPQGVMNTAQGFFVNATGAGSQVVFNNGMRLGNSSNQFFKQPNATSLSRYWLYASGSDNAFASTVIGYTPVATLGYDNGIDGRGFSSNTFYIYSILPNENLVIQGRPEFDINDTVDIGLNADIAGTYNITIGQSDGIFANGQDIYLKDNLLGIVHDFADGAYTFTTEAGTFNTRFQVVYTTEALSLDESLLQNITAYCNNKQLTIVAKAPIESASIYDMAGRLIYQKNSIGTTDFTSSPIPAAQEIAIVKITLQNKQTATKKIILK